MTSKYIFLDIDGTLVNFKAQIPPSAITALKQAQKNGHKLIIATGRQRRQVYPQLLQAIRFDGILTSTGAHIEHDGRTIFQSLIEGDDLALLVERAKRDHVSLLLIGEDGMYGDRSFHEIVLPYMRKVGYSEALIQGAYGNVRMVDDLCAVKKIEKASYFLCPYTTDAWSERLENRFYVVDYSVGKLKTEQYFGELTLSGVSKGSAIERYMAHIGAPISDTIAIGDSGNDIDMIRMANVGVAMGNATEPIKQAADYITSDIDDDGILHALEHLGLL